MINIRGMYLSKYAEWIMVEALSETNYIYFNIVSGSKIYVVHCCTGSFNMFENFETWIQLELPQKANCRCVTRTENKCNNHLPNMISFVCFFCVVIRFFHPRRCQWPPTLKDFYTRSYPLHYFLILILEKEPVFPFSMLSAKQGHYWYHVYNAFGMTRSLTGDWTRDLPHSIPALYH